MLKVLTTLMRGAAAEAEEALFEANAVRILEQQLRDAAASLEHAKRDLACVIAHRSSETRAVDALDGEIAKLEESGARAISGGRMDLAGDVAVVVAANEDERAERLKAIEGLDRDILRLRELAADGRRRLGDLVRGLETARAQQALRRAGANGRRALATGAGALRDAEATLQKIRDSSLKAEDLAKAEATLEAEAQGSDIARRLSEAGFGPDLKTKPADVLERLRKMSSPGNGATAAAATPASPAPVSAPRPDAG